MSQYNSEALPDGTDKLAVKSKGLFHRDAELAEK